MSPEARLEDTGGGLAPATESWFVVNIRDSPRSELALSHGAGVEQETTSPAEAYAPYPKWLPGKPDFAGMPWE